MRAGGAAKSKGELITTGEMQRKLPSEAGLRKQILYFGSEHSLAVLPKVCPQEK